MCWLRKSMTRGEKRTVYIYIYTYGLKLRMPILRPNFFFDPVRMPAKRSGNEKS